MDADTKLNRLTDGRPEAFFDLLKQRAEELCEDFPFQKNDAFEYLWALTSSLEGTTLACDDWYKKWTVMMTVLVKLLAAGKANLGNWPPTKTTRDALRTTMDEVEQTLKDDLTIWNNPNRKKE